LDTSLSSALASTDNAAFSDIGETVESLLGKLSPIELQTLGCTIDAIDYARRAEISIYKQDPPSFSLLAEHPEGGLIVGKHVTQEEKDQITWRLWYILAMLMVDDDMLADEEQTPWDENCLSVTLYCWVKHLMGVNVCTPAFGTILAMLTIFIGLQIRSHMSLCKCRKDLWSTGQCLSCSMGIR
jgi:hypothetical protein